jgi:hypothetical protein
MLQAVARSSPDEVEFLIYLVERDHGGPSLNMRHHEKQGRFGHCSEEKTPKFLSGDRGLALKSLVHQFNNSYYQGPDFDDLKISEKWCIK